MENQYEQTPRYSRNQPPSPFLNPQHPVGSYIPASGSFTPIPPGESPGNLNMNFPPPNFPPLNTIDFHRNFRQEEEYRRQQYLQQQQQFQ